MFHSTRSNKLVAPSEAIVNGLASDGGLYVIDELPKVNYKDLIDLDYPSLASKIISLFFDDLAYEDIYNEVKEAYESFDIDSVVEVKSFDDICFLELFHGPTLAFKDLALVVLPRLMKLAKKKLKIESKTTILTATSGDTGGAALNGFKDVEGINIIVLYPDGGVSPVQEAQMHSFKGKNSFVYAVDGNFDDCQNFVKRFFEENTDLNLSSANSINIARLVPQIVYYFYTYIKLLNDGIIKEDEVIDFTVPTGNFGNILAAFYAKNMGIPIAKLICASNDNKVLYDFFTTGTYDKNREFMLTTSPSMDILISSNLERLIYRIAGNDAQKNAELMRMLVSEGVYEITPEMKANLADFYGNYASEAETADMIKSLYEKTGYVIDTHTAVAATVYKKYQQESGDCAKTVIASTASPYKFTRSVMNAINEKYDTMDDFALVDELSRIGKVAVPQAIEEIRKAEVRHKTVCEVEEMPAVVKQFLGI